MPKGIYSRKSAALPLIYVARESFTTMHEGGQISVLKGVTVREGHPLLSGRMHLFVPQKVDYEFEQEPEPEPEPEVEPEPAAAAVLTTRKH